MEITEVAWQVRLATKHWGVQGGTFPPASRLEERRFIIYKLIVCRFDRDKGSFDDSEFEKFCEEHQILSIEKQFFNVEGNVYYSFFIEYQRIKKRGLDIKDLDEQGRRKYDNLRDWRNELALNEGIPPYIILYNKQIVDIVKSNPMTIRDLEVISGLKNKALKYGKDILRVLEETDNDLEE